MRKNAFARQINAYQLLTPVAPDDDYPEPYSEFDDFEFEADQHWEKEQRVRYERRAKRAAYSN